jgi:prepilin-type N-terminal cleavage/methylation domain-containing protein
MKTQRNQRGFSAVELVIVIAVLAIVGLVGYRVISGRSTSTSTTKSAATSENATASVSSAPAIKSTSDLDKAQQTLDQNDPATSNASDSNQLDSSLSGVN